MVLDGLYMSLIGLSVVFMVLVVLLVTINILNYFDKKSATSLELFSCLSNLTSRVLKPRVIK